MLENILREGMRYSDSDTVGERHAPVLDAQLHGPGYNGCDDLHTGLRKGVRGKYSGTAAAPDTKTSDAEESSCNAQA